jgi:DegV family protein with EDD domain
VGPYLDHNYYNCQLGGSKMIKIFTDSTCDMPKDLVEKNKIELLSLYINFGTETIKEMDISNEEFYKRIDKEDSLPTTSQPSIQEMTEKFEGFLKEGIDVIAVLISSGLSGTFSTANMVKEALLSEYPERNIEIIDSKSTSMQMGFAALIGAKSALENCDFKTSVEKIKSNIKSSRFLFTPHNMDYLKKGGRIGGAAALIGNILKINPVLTVGDDGVVEIVKKIRTKKKAVQGILDRFQEDVEKYGFGDAVVHHINTLEEAKILAKKVEDIIKRPVRIADIGPVVGAHVGPGSVGIAYYTEKEMR